jgi:hypothetical protein
VSTSEGAAAPPPRSARERDDLLLLLLCAALVPLLWLVLGWRLRLCVSGYDAWATALPLLQALREAGGDWGALAYRPDLLGGITLRDGVGPNPLAGLLARAGLSPTSIYNVCAFALQALLGFFGARAASDLARTFGTEARTPWLARAAAALLSAFAPWLGWRIGYGHLALTTGLLPFAAALALVTAAAARRVTLTLCVVAALATADGLLFTGHQLVLYAIVFGAPVLAGVWLCGRQPARTLTAPALALGAGVLLAAPALLAVIRHGLGGDAPRPPVGLHITYSYLTARPLDWLTSLPWTKAFVPSWRPPLHLHESNVPVGPLLVLLVLVPWRRARPLAVLLALAAALMLAFSMDVRPLSSALIALVPPLGSFRVPTRAALPLLIALAPIACAAALAARTVPRRPPAVWVAVLLAVAAVSVGAFRQRLLPFRDTEALLAQARAIGAEAAAREPALRDPLVRVAMVDEVPELGANTAFAAGLSSIDGYFFPTRRFIELVTALRGQPYDPSAFVLRFREDERAARVLFALYDVRFAARDAARTDADVSVPAGIPPARGHGPWRLELRALDAGGAPAWFPTRTAAVVTFAELAARLHETAAAAPWRLRETAWLVASDPATASVSAPPACSAARVDRVAGDRLGHITAEVRTPAACPLVVATNFAEPLRARARVGGGWQPARLFPAYGALLGVALPAGATHVEVAPR